MNKRLSQEEIEQIKNAVVDGYSEDCLPDPHEHVNALLSHIEAIEEEIKDLSKANSALIEVEKRLRESSKPIADYLNETSAPSKVKEAYQWCVYASCIHAQSFIVKDKP